MKLTPLLAVQVGAGAVGTYGAYKAANSLVLASAVDDVAGTRRRPITQTETHTLEAPRDPLTSKLTLALTAGAGVLGGFGGYWVLNAIPSSAAATGTSALKAFGPRAAIGGAVVGAGLGTIVGAISANDAYTGIDPRRIR